MARRAPVNDSFELVEEGTHMVRLVQVIDLGTSEGTYGKKRTTVLGYEVVGDEITDSPRLIWERASWVMSPKSKLRSRVEALVGRTLSNEEARSFDIYSLAEETAAAMAHIVHVERNGSTFANIESLSPLPKRMTAPEARSQVVLFDLDQPDRAVFDQLSDKLRETIVAS